MRAPLAYSKKIYLASLALFWGGLCAGFLAVLLLSCRQSFAARTRALLDRQHTVAATLANDTAALPEEQRPQTVPALWRQTGRSLRAEGLALAVWQDGRSLYSDLALADLPEAAALAENPGYEARVATDFDGGAAPMAEEARNVPVGTISPDQAFEQAVALLQAGGADTGGEWVLTLYPAVLAATVGAEPMFVLQHEQTGYNWEMWLDADGRLHYLFDACDMVTCVGETRAALGEHAADYEDWAAERNAWAADAENGAAWLRDLLLQAGWEQAEVTPLGYEGDPLPTTAAALDEALGRPWALAEDQFLQFTAVDENGVPWRIGIRLEVQRVLAVIREAELGENLCYDEDGRLMNRRGEALTPFFYAMFVNRYR